MCEILGHPHEKHFKRHDHGSWGQAGRHEGSLRRAVHGERAPAYSAQTYGEQGDRKAGMRVCMNLAGSIKVASCGGRYYAMIFFDDVTWVKWANFLTGKGRSMAALRSFLNDVATPADLAIPRYPYGRRRRVPRSISGVAQRVGHFASPPPPQIRGSTMALRKGG